MPMSRRRTHAMRAPRHRVGSARGLSVAAALLLVCGAFATAIVVPAVITATPAQAASYRYWSYWHGSTSSWTYASQGAGTFRPKDGTVDGWRFAATSGSNSSSTPPRAAASFSSLCAGVAATAGTRRIGLVIDYGTVGDAPNGEKPRSTDTYCVRIADGGTGLFALKAVAAYRSTPAGLICGINNYPKAECAAIVRTTPTTVPSASAKPTSKATPTITGSTRANSSKAAASPDASAPPTPSATTSSPATAPAVPQISADASSNDAAGAPVANVVDASAASTSTGSPLPTVIAFALLAGVATALVIARRRRP